MTSVRLFFVSLALVAGAFGCGGRSAVRTDAGGGRTSDARTGDARLAEGGVLPDGGAVDDGGGADRGSDGAPGDAARPDLRDGGGADLRPTDAQPGMLVGVDVTPALATVAVNTTIDLRATGRFSDGTTRDLTAMAMWTSASPMIASVMGGAVRGLTPGTAIVRAAFMGATGMATVTVTAAPLTMLTVEPVDVRLPVTIRQQYKATGTFADGTKQDLTTQVTWSSTEPMVASITPSGAMGGLATGLRAGMTNIVATYQMTSGRTVLTVTTATLAALEISPQSPILPLPGEQKFTATGLYSDGTVGDLSNTVTWESSDPLVLSISNAAGSQGLATSVSPGAATVTARLGMTSGTTSVTVSRATLMAITVAPESATVPKGSTQAFTATGRFSDGTSADITNSVAWAAVNPAIASLSNAAGSEGEATGLAPGNTMITATSGAIVGRANLTVTEATLRSLAVTPAMGSVALGRSLQFTATGTYSDGTTRDVTQMASWSVADPMVAGISNSAGSSGEATGLRMGSTGVRAVFGMVTAMATLAVTNAVLETIDVAPPMATVPVGERQSFTARGTYSDGSTLDITSQVTWSSATPAVATVSNGAATRGQATGVSGGTTLIRAALDGQMGTASLTVTAPTLAQLSIAPIAPTRRVGETVQFAASAIFGNGTSQNVNNQTTFTSSNPAVATFGMGMQARTATCVTVGMVTITGSYMGVMDTTTLVCTDPPLVDLQVTPFLASIQVGQAQNFQAVGVYADGTTRNLTQMATWTSSNAMVATVSTMQQRGVVRGVAAGMATITATIMGMTASATVTVIEATLTAINVQPVAVTLRVGQVQQFQAVGVYSDGTTRNLTGMATWTSSNTAVIDVTNGGGGGPGGGGPGGGGNGGRGQATALTAGMAMVTATFMGFSDSASVTVTAAKVTGVSVSPVTARVIVGQPQNFQATALFDDGSTQMVTGQAIWSSSDPMVADISNAGQRGQATGLGAGTVTITASYMGFMGTASLTVSAAKVIGIAVTPPATSLHVGDTQTLQATATFDDGTTQNVTNQAIWSTTDPAVADVTTGGGGFPGGGGGGGGRGIVTGIGPGTAQIRATFMTFMSASAVTVVDANLTRIDVTPANANLPAGTTQQYQAVGVYSDGTSRTITNQTSWTSSNTMVAGVTNNFGRGQVTTLATGTTEISATLDGVTGKTTLTVSDAKVTQIQVTPTNPWVTVNGTQAFVATAVYSDFSIRTVTGLATWASSSTMVAQVSNAGGSRGTATGLSAGTSTISATFDGVTGSTVLTVSAATIEEIQVTPAAPSVPAGVTVAFAATAILSDNTSRDVTSMVTWTSGTEMVATISNVGASRGLATTLGAGTTTISAALSGVSGMTTLTVGSQKLTGITVTPSPASLAVGATQAFTATGNYDNNTTYNLTAHVTWISTSVAVASVSNVTGTRGLATAVGAGMSTVEAHFQGVTGSAALTVTP